MYVHMPLLLLLRCVCEVCGRFRATVPANHPWGWLEIGCTSLLHVGKVKYVVLLWYASWSTRALWIYNPGESRRNGKGRKRKEVLIIVNAILVSNGTHLSRPNFSGWVSDGGCIGWMLGACGLD
ncbi:hypothetical protein BJX64DRAFT_268627 [Aspergillus heterothallicus]